MLEIFNGSDTIFLWGISAVGSAPHSHCGGHGFESRILHLKYPVKSRAFGFSFDYLFEKSNQKIKRRKSGTYDINIAVVYCGVFFV